MSHLLIKIPMQIIAIVAILLFILFFYYNSFMQLLHVPHDHLDSVTLKSVHNETGKYNVLFVHGAWGDRRVWENYMDYFVKDPNIRSVTAFSLQAHGKSGSNGYSYNWRRIADYVSDLNRMIQQYDQENLVLVCHSMGGYVCQKYLEQYDKLPVAMVLLGAIPPVQLKEFDESYENFQRCLKVLSANRMIENYNLTTFMFHHDSLSEDKAQLYYSRTQHESLLALMDITKPLNPIDLEKLNNRFQSNFPLLVVSTANDRMIPVINHQLIVDVYKSIPNVVVSETVFNETVKMAHFLQLDPDWKESADVILNYLSRL
jgi:pimeloyl-ACP methyl ester carboxylesterase